MFQHHECGVSCQINMFSPVTMVAADSDENHDENKGFESPGGHNVAVAG